MESLLNVRWLLSINSILFLLTPIALTINLAIIKKQNIKNKKKIGYIYGSIWAIAFIIYLLIFIKLLS